MNKEFLLDHYRNLYQIVKYDKDNLERELDEYKLLCSIQQDIINSLNERLKKNNNYEEGFLECQKNY